MSSDRAESNYGRDGSTWLAAATRLLTVPVAMAGLLVLSACDSSSVLSPDSSDDRGFQAADVSTSATDAEEQLYLSDSGAQAPNGDGSILFLVELDDTDLEANLTELVTMPEPDFDQVDAIAASTDGSVVYAVDKISSSLGAYDVTAGTFTDMGAVTDLPAGTVLAATAPDGTLWVANQNDNGVYTIDTSATPPTASLVGTMSGTSFFGADLVFDANGDLFFWTNDDTDEARGFYSLDQGSFVASYLGPEPATTVDWFVTGLAIRDAGLGDIVSSTNEDEVRVVDASDGSTVQQFAMMFEDAPYDYEFGDMTVGQLAQDDEGCTLTQGYWQTHNESFRGGAPADETWEKLGTLAEQTEFFDSSETYFDVIWAPVKGNKAMSLAHQYIAAELNLLAGASMPSEVEDAYNAATQYFSENAKDDEFPVVKGNGGDLSDWHETLTDYNEGLIGPGHCDDLEE